MIAHTQTIFGNGDAGAIPGNCMQVAMASLLDLEVGHVPHFALYHDWYQAITLWLSGRGKRLRVYTGAGEHRDYWEHVGVEVADLDRAPSGQMMLASGPSHNGPWHHIVVWKAGQLVHDTHPNGKGLNGPPDEFWQITDVAAGVPKW